MSNSAYDKYIELLNRASSSSNDAERKILVDQANKICRDPEFLKGPSNGFSSSNNSSGLTSSPATYNGYSVNSGLTSIPTTTTSTPYSYQNGWYVDYRPGGY